MSTQTEQRINEAWQFELNLADAQQVEGHLPEAIESYLRVLTLLELKRGGETKVSKILLNGVSKLLDKLDYLKGVVNSRERACRYVQDRLHDRYSIGVTIRQILAANKLLGTAPTSISSDTTADS